MRLFNGAPLYTAGAGAGGIGGGAAAGGAAAGGAGFMGVLGAAMPWIGVGMAIFGAVKSGKQRREAAAKEKAATARRMALEANRQDVPDFQQDMLNPYANLQVATQANIMQAEQADISLASSLDTLRATGASAGGATALARAAAQSKRGVAASIEQQEARNAQLRAQGEMQAAQMRQKGQVYAFQAQEAREMTQLDREASLESSYNQQAAAYGGQSSLMAGQAVGSTLTAVSNILSDKGADNTTGYQTQFAELGKQAENLGRISTVGNSSQNVLENYNFNSVKGLPGNNYNMGGTGAGYGWFNEENKKILGID